MKKKLQLKELEEWSVKYVDVGAFGGAGYNGAEDYKNGKYIGEGKRKFLQHFYDKWNND